MVPKTGIPKCHCILPMKYVGREILYNDDSMIREHGWHRNIVDMGHIPRERGDWRHHLFVRDIGTVL